MKKVSLFLISLMMISLPVMAESVVESNFTVENSNSKIFIYHIPENFTNVHELLNVSNTDNNKSPAEIIAQQTSITSDDVTADTSIHSEESDVEINQDSASNTGNDHYAMHDMYTDVLKGYASYDENEEDAVSLEDTIDKYQTIEIIKPHKITTLAGSIDKSHLTQQKITYSKYDNMEYSIAPKSSRNYRSKGGFSAGTMFNQGIDYAELESSTGVFSRYDHKYFALSSAYMKTINSTNNNYNDNFYFSPELKLNQYFTLREVMSADIARNRKKIEVVLSVNPFGKKDSDRLKLEFGANSTFDDKNTVIRNQFKFSTNFKL